MDEPKPQTVLPPRATFDEARSRDSFLIEGEESNLWFERRSRILFVTFDNLATLDDPYPRLPWLHARIAALGYSLLGVQSFRKDWYRQATAPRLIRELQSRNFFADFDRVVMVGVSMGGFAALNFAPLVPGSHVLAFSPQSTMSKVICPFEQRFPYSVNRSNWTDLPFLDAAEAIPFVTRAVILYDPFVPEDRQHAARMQGANVTFLRCGHYSHQAIRIVIKCDALPQMLREYAETGTVGADFWRRMRARRPMRAWRRNFIENLSKSAHPKLTLRACDLMLAEEQYFFARKARKELLARHPELAGR